jgi:tyrosyl-tRNA synthetase
MFGKVMRISDEMIAHYIDVALDARPAEKDEWKSRAADEPMPAKKWIAGKLTAMYNGAEAAARAEEHFRRTVQEKSVDLDDAPEVRVPDAWRAEHLGLDRTTGQGAHSTDELQQELQPRLVDLLVELQLAPSKSEARRLLTQGGVKLDGSAVTDQFTPYIHVEPTLLQVGKRRFVRLV